MDKAIFIRKIMNKTLLFKIILFFLGTFSDVIPCFSQLPACYDTGGVLYFDDGRNIYRYDPAKPTSATNPVVNTLSYNGVGLALCPNLNAVLPVITFYTRISGNYHYHDGSQWVNTGHKASAVNLGAGGGYVYGINPGSMLPNDPTRVYQYDGSGDDKLLLALPDAPGSLADIIADCDGNFYVLNIGVASRSPAQWMRKYNSEGHLLYQWNLKGVPYGIGGGGFAIIDNTVYFDMLSRQIQIYKGDVKGDTLDFSLIDNLPNGMKMLDMANCPKPLFSSSKDTLFYCGNTAAITVQGIPPYTYTVVSGDPIVTGSGPDFTVNCSTLSEIVFQSRISGCGNDQTTDTFVVVPPPKIDAGPDETIEGCAFYTTTLAGGLLNSTPWVDYHIQWTPGTSIASGAHTLHPVIQPHINTDYILTVTTGPGQGGCIFRDTVAISVMDRSVSAGFSYAVYYGCEADTVHFTSESTPGISYQWDFDDGSHSDFATNPLHVYPLQGTYHVRLNVSNGICSDIAVRPINTAHPLQAAFSMDQDTICINGTVRFINTSTVTRPDSATFVWDFGDGTQSFSEHPEHQYLQPGVYAVKMMVTDFVPCTDTAYATIIVDPIIAVDFITDRDSICVGESIIFSHRLNSSTLTDLRWDFGEGNGMSIGTGSSIQHAYEHKGIKRAMLNARFRACPDESYADTVYVFGLPNIYLGSDTGICFNGSPTFLKNLRAAQDGVYYSLWNTGDTTESIPVIHPGIYSLTVNNEPLGCSTTESIEIKRDCYTDLPNAFTPNGDGYNDYFFPRQWLTDGVRQYHMQVWNRWGQLVFETYSTSGRGWDGRFNSQEQAAGVYPYLIQVEFANGKKESIEGNITLLR